MADFFKEMDGKADLRGAYVGIPRGAIPARLAIELASLILSYPNQEELSPLLRGIGEAFMESGVVANLLPPTFTSVLELMPEDDGQQVTGFHMEGRVEGTNGPLPDEIKDLITARLDEVRRETGTLDHLGDEAIVRSDVIFPPEDDLGALTGLLQGVEDKTYSVSLDEALAMFGGPVADVVDDDDLDF